MENNLTPNPADRKETSILSKLYRSSFFILIFLTVLLEYQFYIFEVIIGTMNSKNYTMKLIQAFIFHFLLFLVLFSLIVTMITNPGEIPPYWGFKIGDQEKKRKRYCLICNAFKPERSHHCSMCNLCVLNMDHHCPWVNNCVGFYNRKFFMQLLFYVFLTTIYIDITGFTNFYKIIRDIYVLKWKFSAFSSLFSIVFAYIINLVISILITFFFKFHLKLVINNTTTIETLDPQVWFDNKYNLTVYENWVQVFGTNKLLWFLPILSESGYPQGNGLDWKDNLYTNTNDENSNNAKTGDFKSKSNTNLVANSLRSSELHENKSDLSKIIIPLDDKTRKLAHYKNNADLIKHNIESSHKSSTNHFQSTKDEPFIFSPGTTINNVNSANQLKH